MRILHGLDRFSEDLDFSLLRPTPGFDMLKYSEALRSELRGFGFEVTVESREKGRQSAIQSAFIKSNTPEQLVVIETSEELVRVVPKGQMLKIRLEVDTDPPPGFSTEVKYLLHPIPFPVRSYALPDLFAGKMHALLWRRWKTRVKGRDWYDFVWFVANHPALHLSHLERRMVQTGDWKEGTTLTGERLLSLLRKTIQGVDLKAARQEVEPFVSNPDSLVVWSKKFFLDISSRVVFV